MVVVCFSSLEETCCYPFLFTCGLMFFSIRFVVFMLYDTNVGPFIRKDASVVEKIRKGQLFLMYVKNRCPSVFVMKY